MGIDLQFAFLSTEDSVQAGGKKSNFCISVKETAKSRSVSSVRRLWGGGCVHAYLRVLH